MNTYKEIARELAEALNGLLGSMDGLDRLANQSDVLNCQTTLAKYKAMEVVPSPTDAALGWQPIETAPKDEKILIFGSDNYIWKGVNFGFYHSCFNGHINKVITLGGRSGPTMQGHMPTHWMPLPAPPSPEQSEDPNA